MIRVIALILLLIVQYSTTQSNGDIRLVNLNNEPSHDGRLEIYLQNEWGTVCDDEFGIFEANVVCTQLGFIGAINYGTAGALGYSDGNTLQRIALDNVNCTSSDGIQHILSCNYTTQHDCNHFEDVAVVCNATRLWLLEPYTGQIRLNGGFYPSEGKVEVYCNGQWGTVCDDFFQTKEADTVCQQLGYTNAIGLRSSAQAGNATQPIWLDNVHCAEVQSCITTCQMCPERQDHDCAHTEDVVIRCTYNVNVKSSEPVLRKTCAITSSTVHVGIVVGIVVTCLLTICCFILTSLVIVASCCIVYKKKTEKPTENSSTSTQKCILSPSAVLNPSADQPIPPPRRPCDLGEEIYEQFPTSVDEQPVYILSGNDKVIYIQPPPATTPLDHMQSPPPYSSLPMAPFPASPSDNQYCNV